MRKKHIYSVTIVTAIMTVTLLTVFMSAMAVSKPGSTGAEVRQIQTKLKNWGYYNGSVDGIYGWQTQSAVKSFQKKKRA